MSAQEVHDVVFRVRFGGYDEWQVDLHLDRVERQLAELEESGMLGRAPEPPALPSREPRPMPMRDDRPMPPPRDERGMPLREDRPMPPRDERHLPPPREERAMPLREERAMPLREDRGMPLREERAMPLREERPMAPRGDDRQSGPVGPPRVARPMPPGMPVPPVSGPPVSGPPVSGPPVSGPPMGAPPGPPPRRPMQEDNFTQQLPPIASGFEPGRHGKPDMTSEIPAADSPFMPDDIHRLEQLRRTFQQRRFGSGYDPTQVNRLFDAIAATMAGRSAVPVTDGELDPGQFSLVQGGLFEAEVDNALREVRDLFARRGVAR